MKAAYLVKFLVMSAIFSSSIFAGYVDIPNETIFVSEDSIDNSAQEVLSHQKNKDHLIKILKYFVLQNKGKFGSDVEARKRGAFLLTGVVVYQTTRVIGHASIWTAAGLSIAGGFAVGGPAGAAAAYLNAVATIGPASAAVESASLVIGTAASWIPGLP